MNIGYGTTAFEKTKHQIDGIGNYTIMLYQNIKKNFPNEKIYPVIFNKSYTSSLTNNYFSTTEFKSNSFLSYFFNKTLREENELKKKIDIFHSPDHYIPKFRDIPSIATIHDAIAFSNPEWLSFKHRYFINPVFKKSASWTSQIITVSDYSKKQINFHFKIKEEKISVIPLGVDELWFKNKNLSEIDKVNKKYNLFKNYLISVGTIQPRKNLFNLIVAYKKLPEKIKKEFNLVIVGRLGWKYDKILTNELSDSKKGIIWLKYVPKKDLVNLVKGSASLIFPSLSEGFGLPVLEGFASETPVITSNVTSLPEIANDAALLINPSSTNDISNGIISVITDDKFSQSLVEKGKKRAKLFNWSRTADLTLKLYKKVLNKANP